MEKIKKSIISLLIQVLGIPATLSNSVDQLQEILFAQIKKGRVFWCIGLSFAFFLSPIFNIMHIGFLNYVVIALTMITILSYPFSTIGSYFDLDKKFTENNKIFPLKKANDRSRSYNKIWLSNETISFLSRIYSYLTISLLIIYVTTVSNSYWSLILTAIVAILLLLTLLSATFDFRSIFEYASTRKIQGFLSTLLSLMIIIILFIFDNDYFNIPIIPVIMQSEIYNIFFTLSIFNFVPAALVRLPVDIAHQYLILENDNRHL